MRHRPLPPLLALLAALGGSGCSRNLAALQSPRASVAVVSPNLGSSMLYAARTDSGVVLVDLGWTGAAGSVEVALDRLGATPAQVTDVFLTHSHRDHVVGWRVVPRARYHLYAPEVPYFVGGLPHRDAPSRVAAAVLPDLYPPADSLDVRPYARDTAFVLGGADTLRAFAVPGHTAGSAAYLFRGVLFVGDAVYYGYLRGFRPAARLFTADAEQNRRSLESLWERLAPYRVEWVCTAHAKCARHQALRDKLDRDRPPG